MNDEQNNDEEITTVLWVNPETAELVEVDVPVSGVEKFAAGGVASGYGGFPMRRFSAKDGQARLRARLDQIRERLDELVTEHPELKSHSPRRPPDEN